jgi:hypothetical protein
MKVHPEIFKGSHGAMEVQFHSGVMKLIMESSMITVELWRLRLELWRLTLELWKLTMKLWRPTLVL